MTRRNYVCVDDRHVLRVDPLFRPPLCSACGKTMLLLWRGNVPAKDDVKGWKRLQGRRTSKPYIDGKP